MPNSPPIEMTTPVRMALNHELDEPARDAARRWRALRMTSPTSTTRDERRNRRTSRRTSSSMPTVMKNRPSRMSRNGRITVSI